MRVRNAHILERGDVVNETYTVQCFIGQGAFGEVYRVEHKYMGLQALKVFKDDYVSKTDLNIVTSEAKVLAGLVHKNIVRVFEANAFTRNGKKHHFLTVGFVSGESLSQLLKREIHLSIPVSLSIQRGILQGLSEVHRQNPPILHRDISPDNVLLSYDDDRPHALLSDFGLAQSFDQMSKIVDAAGKYLYLAPECFWGAYLPASDVFSAGVVLYRMLTGCFPWNYDFDSLLDSDRDGISRVISKARNAAVRAPSAYNFQCSENLDRITMRAIDKDLEARYQDAGTFLSDLSSELKVIIESELEVHRIEGIHH